MSEESAWSIDDSEFYEIESRDEQLRFLLRYAILAPSRDNVQPWRFRITPEGIEVLPDVSCQLDRELWLSIGAAIANLRVAAAHFNFDTTVLFNADKTLVACRETCATDDDLRALFPAIKKRHTNRRRFGDDPLEPELVQHLCDFVDRNPQSTRLMLQRDHCLVKELVPIENAAALILITAEDDRVSLVAAGERLERLLLQITLDNLDYSLVSVTEPRERLWALAGATRPPQVLLRVGRARKAASAVPRRPLEAVLA
jgi:hypothetical protein